MLFTLELNRRIQAEAITNVIAANVHPGFVCTNLKEPFFAGSNWLVRQVLKLIWKLPFVQTPEFGALPLLYAATAHDVKPNDYYVPDRMQAWSGHPTFTEPLEIAKSETALWQESERLAKLTFTL